MRETGKYIVIATLWTIVGLALSPYVFHQEFTAQQAVVCKCVCFKCQSAEKDAVKYQDRSGKLSELNGVGDEPRTDDWQRGEFVAFRMAYTHQQCGGHLVFNGQAKPAPYSEKEFFYTHVCDKCGATNQILNATWPQFKQEWRAL